MLNVSWRPVLDGLERIAIIVACGAVAYTAVVNPLRESSARAVAERPPQPDDVRSKHWSIPLNPRSVLKTKDAKIAIVEFSDFECPFCRRHARDTLPRLRAAYVDTGKVQYDFKHFPLAEIHKVAMDAASHAACAGQQSHFWEMHDYLFQPDSILSPEFLTASGRRLHLNMDNLAQCLAGVGSDIANERNIGSHLGVTSTPTFFIGQVDNHGVMSAALKLTGAYPYESFAKAIDQLTGDLTK